MNEFLAKLKRLLGPRPEPPAKPMGESTADRPPPPVAEAPPVQAATPRAEAPPPQAEAPPRPVEAPPPREPAALAAEDLAEVRAALEAVAEVPVAAAEVPVAAPEPEPLAPEGEALPAPQQEPVEVPAPVATVGDALVLTLGTPPATFTVAKTGATLGRGQENTIRLDDLSVSRRHARIVYRQGGFWVSDLGSMGGTWVDGTRLNAPHKIAAGQVIDIGLCRLTVDAAGGAAAAETKKSANPDTRKTAASRPRSEMAAQSRRRR